MGMLNSLDESVDVISLRGSLQPLRDHFNANSNKPRFLALLSPT